MLSRSMFYGAVAYPKRSSWRSAKREGQRNLHSDWDAIPKRFGTSLVQVRPW